MRWPFDLFGGKSGERRLDSELRFHLEQQTKDNIAAGMSPEAARREAAIGLGGLEQIKEECRDERSGAWLSHVSQDLRIGLRMLRKNPTFTAIAVLSLALGIGAATSVFSLVDAVLLGSLPVPNPQDLRVICWSASDMRMMYITLTGDPVVLGRRAGGSFSKDVFLALRKQCAPQADVFGYSPFFGGTARARGLPVKADGLLVSGNFFSGLGANPLVGSLLGPEDEAAGSVPRVVISYRWWRQQFGLDPRAIGQQVTINGNNYTIAGVLPQAFTGVCPGDIPDLYVSLSDKSLPMQGLPKDLPALWWIAIMGRMKPGVSTAQLQAVVDVTLATQADKFITKPSGFIADGRDGPVWKLGGYRTQLQLLMAVVGVVLLVACLNIGGLLLARGSARQRELSLREALGANRQRIVRQLLTESALISVFGGALGILAAVWGRLAVSRLLAGSPGGLHFDTTFDARVLAFALAVTCLTVLLAGLFPALKAARLNPRDGLWQRAGGGTPPLRAGQFLVAAQIALSLVLVTGAGLYFRTLVNLMGIEPGFAMDHLLSFAVNPGDSGYQTPQTVAYLDQIQRALSAVPGVRSAALVSNPLLGNWLQSEGFTIPNRVSGGQNMGSTVLTVSETFFGTIGVPITDGRDFRASDADGALKVIIVNESFVRKFLAGSIPVGRTIKFGDIVWQIVGVCRDSMCFDIKKGVDPTTYFPYRQHPIGNASIVVRTLVSPSSVAKAVLSVAAAVDTNVSVDGISTEEQIRDRNITPERMLASFCSLLAAFVMLLSSIGLFGLMTYDVARRTSEFGVRMALGATPLHIMRPILKRAMVLASAGLAVGLPLTLVLTRLIRSNLYGVTPFDPGTICGAVAMLMAVVLVAAWIPVWRATRIDPMIALRCE
jgi:predicted permease